MREREDAVNHGLGQGAEVVGVQELTCHELIFDGERCGVWRADVGVFFIGEFVGVVAGFDVVVA